MFTYTALTLFAVLSQAVMGSPIEKRATNTVIRSGRNGQCLSLPSGVQPANGVGLVTRDCKTATRWDISPGSGSVIVTGTNFALDAGVPQGNNMYAKVWQSYPGSQQQTWFLTADNRIAVTGGNQCLDEGDNGPQTYQCTNGNTNQVWYVDNATAPPASSSASASASASASKSSSASASPSASGTSGKQIKFSNGNLCAVVLGNAGDGTPVSMANCDSSAGNQRFSYLPSGLIQYQGTNFCLDAGSNPANGVTMKLWTCYPGLSQQTFTSQGALLATANNQCLDVDNANSSKLQTWTCSANDVQQQFSF